MDTIPTPEDSLINGERISVTEPVKIYAKKLIMHTNLEMEAIILIISISKLEVCWSFLADRCNVNAIICRNN
jgi:hypothetical protein